MTECKAPARAQIWLCVSQWVRVLKFNCYFEVLKSGDLSILDGWNKGVGAGEAAPQLGVHRHPNASNVSSEAQSSVPRTHIKMAYNHQ